MQEQLDYWVVSDRCLIEDQQGALSVQSAAFAVRGSRIVLAEVDAYWRRSRQAELAALEGTPIHDVGNSPVVPSFVNGHSHLAMAPLRGMTSALNRQGNVVSDIFFAVESHMTSEDVRAFTRIGAWESITCGVGEVWDHFYFGEAIANGLADVGMTGVVAPTLQDLAGPGKHKSDSQLEATRRIAESERLSAIGIRAAVGPHATDTVSDQLFARAHQLALDLNLPVHLHVAQSFEEMEAGDSRFRRGMAIELSHLLAECRVLFAHGLHLSDADCALLAERGWVMAYCPFSQLQFGFLGPLASWRRAGGAWVLGTDCVASNDALDVQRELALLGEMLQPRPAFPRNERSCSQGGRLRLVVRSRPLARTTCGSTTWLTPKCFCRAPTRGL